MVLHLFHQRQLAIVGMIGLDDPPADLAAITAIFTDIELHRKQVLDPMSHAPAVPLTASEVQATIDSVEAMIDALQLIPK